MPAIALVTLSLMVALPTLSNVKLYAAGTQRFTTITVAPGDTLWSIAAAHGQPNGDIQETIDRITEANHLAIATIQPGEHLQIPQ
jgi:LysM repeat protein